MASVRIEVKYSSFVFSAQVVAGAQHSVVELRRQPRQGAHGGTKQCTFFVDLEPSARRWLGDMGLTCRLSRRLLDAAIRNEGTLWEKRPKVAA